MTERLRCMTLALAALSIVFSIHAAESAAPDTKSAADLDKDPRLQGWWKFDETTGTAAADSSSHKRKGVLKAGLSFDTHSVPGKFGKALQIDRGASHCVEISEYKGVLGTHPRTVAAWIKKKDAKGRIIEWGKDDGGMMFIFEFMRNSSIGVTPKGGYLHSNEKVHDDKWHHVAVVVQKADLPNLHDDVILYVDGRKAQIHDIGVLDLWPIDTVEGQNVIIGPNFGGAIDDVRIYDRALSKEEMKLLGDPRNK